MDNLLYIVLKYMATTPETHITYNYHSLEWVWAEAALNTKLLSDSMGYLYRFERRMITPFLRDLSRRNSLTNSLVHLRLKLICKITRKTKLIKLKKKKKKKKKKCYCRKVHLKLILSFTTVVETKNFIIKYPAA
jgi:hypothetical protein